MVWSLFCQDANVKIKNCNRFLAFLKICVIKLCTMLKNRIMALFYNEWSADQNESSQSSDLGRILHMHLSLQLT